MLSIPKKTFFSAAIGTMVEYYDYALFTTFLPMLAPVFFHAASDYQALVKGYFLLLATMIVRPIGGILFGHIGDKYGRRKALLLSMYGIAFATIAIGLTPGYQTIGIWSTILILLAKSIQTFCFAGEYNGAGIYIVEHAKGKKEGLAGSLLSAMALVGALFASLVGALLTLPGMPSASWRAAFLFGGILGLAGIIYRKNLVESPQFKQDTMNFQGFLALIRKYPKALCTTICVGGFVTMPYLLVVVFLAPIAITKGLITNHQFMLLQIYLNVVAVLSFIPAGLLADKYSPRLVMRLSAAAMLLLAYPLLWLLDQGGLFNLMVTTTAFIIINEMLLGPCHAYFKQTFSTAYRYRGASFGFCIGMSAIGGTTPIIATALYHYAGNFSLIAIWLAVISLVTFISL